MTPTQNNSDRDPNLIEDLINNQEPVAGDDPAYEQIFRDLQGGVIKNYGRQYSLYIFIQFAKNKVSEVKEWIRDEIASSVTSTQKQLEDTKTYREKRKENPGYAGELCENFFLSAGGYSSLRFDLDELNNEAKIDDTFQKGMNQDWRDKYKLDEPPDDYWYNPPERWDFGGKNEDRVDALILLAHDDLAELKQEAETIIDKWEKLELGKVVACEAGYVLRDENRQTIGPFGFADGISQPLFLKRDYERYKENHNKSQWNPFASLNLVLVKDPFGESYSYGSYCVFQKLETNYELFEQKIGELAKTLGSDRDRAGALVFGRFKDGTPIALSNESNQDGDRHSFNYADDPNGSKCPLHAHIRKVNPRHDKDELAEERRTKNRIFRAGTTYFDNPNPRQTQELSILQQCLNKLDYFNEINKRSLEKNIASISGLLFVCFQQSISEQFSTLQREWADDVRFPKEREIGEDKYLDPVIGHHLNSNRQKSPDPQEWQKQWNEMQFSPYSFYGCIKEKGGEFFFMPSISFLKSL